MEEDGRLERHCSHSRPVSGRGQPPDWFIFRGRRCNRNRPRTAHRLAGEPGRLSGSPSVSALGGSRTLTPEGTGSWDRRGCQLRHQRERLTGFEPVTSNLASWCSDLLSYNRMERTTGSNPPPTPWQGVALPDAPRPHAAGACFLPLGALARALHTRASSAAVRGWQRHPLSLPPVPTRAVSPYRGLTDADPAGMSWAPRIRT
jgi:hypothetical protein